MPLSLTRERTERRDESAVLLVGPDGDAQPVTQQRSREMPNENPPVTQPAIKIGAPELRMHRKNEVCFTRWNAEAHLLELAHEDRACRLDLRDVGLHPR